MSRFELGGYEGPIPNIALPDPKLSADLPIQSLVLVDGTNFEKADWVALGYTHYEVWCVGAVGGLGAEVGDGSIHSRTTSETVRMPDWMWEDQIYQLTNAYIWSQNVFPVYAYSTVPGHTGEVVVTYDTPRQAAIKTLESQNPGHLTSITHWHDPFVTSDTSPSTGGAGGGGGLHVVSGELAELPDFVPIVVGKAGIDALPGQIRSLEPFDPYLVASTRELSNFPTSAAFDADDENLRQANYDRYYFTNTWPPVGDPARPLLYPGQPGGNGGASSFGDICMASGGKGGMPAVVWVDGVRMFAAHGGEGGVGGRVEAGGGAVGSVSSNANGKDGTWNGEIGQGGGGGRGGWDEVKPSEIQYVRVSAV